MMKRYSWEDWRREFPELRKKYGSAHLELLELDEGPRMVWVFHEGGTDDGEPVAAWVRPELDDFAADGLMAAVGGGAVAWE